MRISDWSSDVCSSDLQAQLDLAYAQYKAGKPDDAVSTLNRFIRTFPTHKHIDYAYYLKALVNFQKENILMERIARLDMTSREMTGVMQSFNDFADLIRRYPSSRTAPDSPQRMVRSEERRVGTGEGRTWRSGWSPV